MNKQENLRVIFTDKAEFIFVEMLKKYNLQESEGEIFNKLSNGKPSKEIMVRRIIEAFVGKIITKEDLENSLKKVLRLDSQTTQKISTSIIKDLIPLLVTASEEKFNDPVFREEISKKVFDEQLTTKTPQELLIEKLKQSIPDDEIEKPKVVVHGEVSKSNGVKKVEVEDVEESAKKLREQREEIARPGTAGGNVRRGQGDPYREATE